MNEVVTRKLELGREAYASGDHQQARAHLAAVVRARDTFADAQNMLGVIAFEDGRLADAQRHLERALEINPRYAEAALHLAICYNEAGRYGDAREVRRVAARRPRASARTGLAGHDPIVKAKIANLHADLGDAYAAVGELDLAATEYMGALDICPSFGDVRLKLAVILRDTGRVAGALAELERLRDDSPGFLRGRLHLGLTCWLGGRHDQARSEWEYVLARDPDNRMAQFYLKLFETESDPSEDYPGAEAVEARV
jgi:tetratricopeptide (TPR) repeat protein